MFRQSNRRPGESREATNTHISPLEELFLRQASFGTSFKGKKKTFSIKPTVSSDAMLRLYRNQ